MTYRYQTGITPHTKSRKVRCLCGFPAPCLLFKLNRSRRFPRTIIQYAVYTFHLIDDSTCNFSEYFPRKFCGFCGHEIGCEDGTKCDGIVIGSDIAHTAYGTHIGQGCEVLTECAVDTCLGDLLAVDSVCILYDAYLLCGYLTDDTNTKSRTRERLTVYQIFRNTKLQTGAADLIFCLL